MDKLLKIEEVAEMLRISRLSVYRMIKDGKLKAVRLPLGRKGKLRVPEAEVNRLIKLEEILLELRTGKKAMDLECQHSSEGKE
jgi:excisionase family DNA binding protein